MAEQQSRLGRPPASSSALTRARIIDVARRQFAAKGYQATSNRALAEEAGLTTGAIYHYFDSKLDIYRSVYDEVQDRVYERFLEVIGGEDTFVGQLTAVLEASHELNREDPTLAHFLGAARVDASRDPVLDSALRDNQLDARRDFFGDMVDLGVVTGEIDSASRDLVLTVIRTVTVGLVDAVSYDVEVHRAAIDGIKDLIDGKLIRPAP